MNILYRILLVCLGLLSGTSAFADDVLASTGKPPPWVIADLAPPFVQLDSKGQLQGIAVDFVQQVLSKVRVDTHILTAPWPRIASEARTEKNILAFAVVRNAEREALFHWITPLVKSRHQVFAHEGVSELPRLQDLQDEQVIAVLAEDYRHDLMLKMNKNVAAYPSWQQATQAFLRGDADFLFASQGVLDRYCPSATAECAKVKTVYTHTETTTYLVLSKSEESAPWVSVLKDAARNIKSDSSFKNRARHWVAAQRERMSVHFDGSTFNLWSNE